jgi:hypothetical protein
MFIIINLQKLYQDFTGILLRVHIDITTNATIGNLATNGYFLS